MKASFAVWTCARIFLRWISASVYTAARTARWNLKGVAAPKTASTLSIRRASRSCPSTEADSFHCTVASKYLNSGPKTDFLAVFGGRTLRCGQIQPSRTPTRSKRRVTRASVVHRLSLKPPSWEAALGSADRRSCMHLRTLCGDAPSMISICRVCFGKNSFDVLGTVVVWWIPSTQVCYQMLMQCTNPSYRA